MKYVLFVFVVLFLCEIASAKQVCLTRTGECSGRSRTKDAIKEIELILKKKASPKAVPPAILAPIILHASLQYHIDYRVLTAVVLVESRGVSTAYNRRTHDYGLMQFNIKTARAMGLSMECITTDIYCSIHAGAKLLSKIADGHVSHYNCGTVIKRDGKLLVRCEHYERLIAAFQ